MSTRTVKLQECDNPKCDFAQVVDDEPATGFHFGNDAHAAGFYILAGGGPIPSFYAHTRKCILPAFDAAMERDS